MADMRGHRQGTKRQDGKWQTVRSVCGERKTFVQRKGESRRQLADRADRWAYEAKPTGGKGETKVARAVEVYLAHRKGDAVSVATLKDDEFAGRLLAGAMGDVRIGALYAAGVDLALRKWHGKPRTAKKVRDFGRKLYNWLEAQQWTDRNPFRLSRPVPYQPETFQEPMPAEHFDAALQQVECPRLRAMFLLLRWTGMRPKSARELLWFELRENQGRLYVCKQKAKTPAGRRPMLVLDPARSAVLSLPKESEYVFPSSSGRRPDFSEKWVQTVWKKAQVDAGLAPRPLYDLKHLRATELVEMLDRHAAADLLGLASPQVLERHYVQIDRKKLEEKVAGVNKV